MFSCVFLVFPHTVVLSQCCLNIGKASVFVVMCTSFKKENPKTLNPEEQSERWGVIPKNAPPELLIQRFVIARGASKGVL